MIIMMNRFVYQFYDAWEYYLGNYFMLNVSASHLPQSAQCDYYGRSWMPLNVLYDNNSTALSLFAWTVELSL